MPITINIKKLVDKIEVHVHLPTEENQKPVYTYNHAELIDDIKQGVLIALDQAINEDLAEKLKKLE